MFKKRMQLVVSAVLVFLLVSISTYAEAKKYQEIDAQTVKEMMESDDALVVFPLSPLEFNDLHIKGSVNIPMDQLESKLPKDKSRKLVFYCLGVKCVASWRGAAKAVELGYKNVYAFREGLPGWIAAGYPTVTTDKIPDVEVRKISTSELAFKLANEPIILVDINLETDVRKFHIDHAKRVQISMDELHLRGLTLDKNRQIVVLCLKGNRAPTAACYLTGKGFENVVAVDGGVQQWLLEGRPVKQGD
jgi:rhodanese-related sulfurtransferase